MVSNDTLIRYGFPEEDVTALEELTPRDGFEYMDEKDFLGMMELLQQEGGELGEI